MGESSFWYRPTRVVPDQRPLNGRCCCCCNCVVFTFIISSDLTALVVLFPIQILIADSEKTLAALDHVIGYYHVAEEVEPVIRDGYAIYLFCL